MKPKKIDWKKVKVDTPIVVENEERFFFMHFACFRKGKVYVWNDGCTSWTTGDVVPWDYARLPTKRELALWKAGRG